jgi:hypothetical protein
VPTNVVPVRTELQQTIVGARIVRILLVDDHEVVRRGLRVLLERQNNWKVCGEAATGPEGRWPARMRVSRHGYALGHTDEICHQSAHINVISLFVRRRVKDLLYQITRLI